MAGKKVSELVAQSPNTASALRRLRTSESLTSGASPVNCSTDVDTSSVTSGGTAGNEHVVLPRFVLDGNGYNVSMNGTVHVVQLATQTDPGDVVLVFAGADNENIIIRDRAGFEIASIADNLGVVLDYPGAYASFHWRGNNWYLDRTNQDDDSAVVRVYKPPTSDPHVAGALWNNSGVPAISLG